MKQHLSPERKWKHIKQKSVNCEYLMASLILKRRDWKDWEENLKDIPHLKIIYEEDISDNMRHQETANKVFAFLSWKNIRSNRNTKKYFPHDLKKSINNYDEVL